MPQRLSAPLRCALLAWSVTVLAGVPVGALAKGGAYQESAHGNRQTGVLRVAGVPRGECAHCHGSPRDTAGRKPDGSGHTRLYAPNDNSLCLGCHARTAGTWLGERRFQLSAHATSPSAVWPGPEPRGRPASDAGKCLNCHDPHGARDGVGLIPHLLRVRGAALCLGCHSGSTGPDVASAFARAFRHPLVAQGPLPGTATPAEGVAAGSMQRPASGGPAFATAQSGTCSGCHNPHAAAEDPVRSATGASDRTLAGVRRIRIANGAAGAPPLRSPVENGDTSLVREFEICFACHGSSGAPGVGQDVSAAFNPANPSFHPLEAAGRNRGVDRRGFTTGWNADRLVTCSDCHGADDGVARGPHGSAQQHILRKRNPARGPSLQLLDTDLCFECHAWRTYAEPMAAAEQRYSRYSGHAAHAVRGVSCWGCHEPHGSATLPALVVRRSPGFVTYLQGPEGGSCTVSCHTSTPASGSYRVAYPR
jgi:predicted CXXCH cytochrome family protein